MQSISYYVYIHTCMHAYKYTNHKKGLNDFGQMNQALTSMHAYIHTYYVYIHTCMHDYMHTYHKQGLNN